MANAFTAFFMLHRMNQPVMKGRCWHFMKEKRSFWIVGGDLRQIKLAELLLEDGHQVQTYAVEQRPEQGKLPGTDTLRGIEEADCVILPLPVMAEHGILNSKLSDRRVPLQLIFQNLRPGQLVCAGKAPPEVRAMAEQAEVVFFDYFAREELEIANAVPTVEGAIQIAMEELPTTLFGTRVLVLGFGRLGKLLAHRLKGLGANVTVAARSYGDLAWIQAYGYKSERMEQLDGWLGGYQLVINTVPARVLDRARLADLDEGTLVIDLASKPGGVDRKAADRLGRQVIWALSLPGKVAPVTAGGAIRSTIYNMLHELDV